jgi:hypothetical protein
VPRLSCWFVRTTFAHLVTGFTADALLLAEKGLAGRPALWRLLPLHLELVLIGWTVQFVLGVAFWMLPRFAGGTSRGDGDRPGWAFWLLNPGVLLSGLGPAAGVSHTQLLGRALDAAAVVAFAIHAWARVRPATSGP